MTIPYTYLITFLPTGQYYYGVSHRKGCSPEHLWTKYFTSSKHIKKLLEEHGKEAFKVEVRKTFDSGDAALLWEHRFLKRVDAARNPMFINRSNGNNTFTCSLPGDLNPSKRPEVRKKISESLRKIDPEVHRLRGLRSKGRKHNSDTIFKLSQIALDRDKIQCKHCGIFATPSMSARWHGDNCLEVNSTPRVSSEIRNNKHSSTLNSEEWKQSTYKTCPHCNKVSDPGNYAKNHGDNCKKLTGVSSTANKKAQETRLKTVSNPEWKIKNYRTCEHCGKVSDPGNHTKHHGSKCKNNNKV